MCAIFFDKFLAIKSLNHLICPYMEKGVGGNPGYRLNCQVMHITVVVCSSDVRPVHELESGEFINYYFVIFFCPSFRAISSAEAPSLASLRPCLSKYWNNIFPWP